MESRLYFSTFVSDNYENAKSKDVIPRHSRVVCITEFIVQMEGGFDQMTLWHRTFLSHDTVGAVCLSMSYGFLYRFVAAALLCSLMIGCVTPNLDSSYELKHEDAVIVIGVEGAHGITITPGHSYGGTWSFVLGFHNRPRVTARDGFVVVRLDPTTDPLRYGIYQVDLDGYHSYTVDYGKKIATFSAEKGTVTYVGTLSFEVTDSFNKFTILMKTVWNPDAAKAHVLRYYPALATKLRSVQMIDKQYNW